MSWRFTILGCGSSPGVPRIGGEDGKGDWGMCDPANPKNRRRRCSLLVEKAGPEGTTVIVIDTSPDFREQMLDAGVTRIDGVLFTHPHADHVHGIDDLRQFALRQRMRIPTWSDEATRLRLYESFGYCYEAPPGSLYPPILTHGEIHAGHKFTVSGPGGPVKILPILQEHGRIHSLGFRFASDEDDRGGLCYSPDVSAISNESYELLAGLDVWIVDALQYQEHLSHFSLGQALHAIERAGPKRAILTHMHIPLDHATVDRETPLHVTPGHDGMVIELAGPGSDESTTR